MKVKSTDEDEDLSNDPTEFLALKSKSFQQLQHKYEHLKQSVLGIFHQLMHQCMDFKQANLNVNMNPLDKKGQIDVFQSIVTMSQVIDIVLNTSKNVCNRLVERESIQEGAYDETLLRLEREIRQLLRSEEKLKIYIECAQLRVNELKQKEKEWEESLKTKHKTTTQQSVKPKGIRDSAIEEEDKKLNMAKSQYLQPPTLNNVNMTQSVSGVGQMNRSQSRIVVSAVRRNYNQNSQISHTIQVTKENQKLRDQVKSAFKGKDMEQQRLTFDLRRLTIRVEELEQENRYLRKELTETTSELRKMKDEKIEEEKQRWQREAVSENPHLVEQFRKRLDEKDKEIKNLMKNIKKFAIVEKKLWVKEKAFEVERADYQDQLLYLNERVSELSKERNTHHKKVFEEH